MTRRSQWFLVAGIVLTSILGVTAFSMLVNAESSTIGGGSRAPSFSGVTLDETSATRTLADYKGKVVILNVWATWCPPCVDEMASFEKLHQEFHSKGLRIVALSIDPPGSEQKVRDFVKEHKLTFEVLHDPANAVQNIYKTVSVPESFVIGDDGIITRKHWGPDNWASESNRALVAQLLGQPIYVKAERPDGKNF